MRVLGIDALSIVAVAPTLLPRPASGESALAMLDPDLVFVNARARDLLGVKDGETLVLRSGSGWQSLRVAGSVATAGPALLVMDIAGAQQRFGMAHRLTRIDLRLQPGQDAQRLLASLVSAAAASRRRPPTRPNNGCRTCRAPTA